MKDLEGRFTYVSPGAERVIGKSADAIVGHSTAETFPSPYAEQYLSRHHEVIDSRTDLSTVEEVPTPDVGFITCRALDQFM